MLKIPGSHKIILTGIGILTIILGLMIFAYPPALFPDPSHGFQVMRAMEMHGPFNRYLNPNQDDITKNDSIFLTWWSPGQYLVPYFIKTITGLSTGKATAVAITLFELSGLTGLYVFFKKIGFTPIIAALSIMFIACQQAFVTPYVFYNGGEILLFGFEGWFLYGCLSIKRTGYNLLLFVLLAGWIGFFCKSSFIWIYIAGLLCIWLRSSNIGDRFNISRLVKTGTWLATPAVVSLASIYIFFLSKGDTPASASTGLKISLQTFSFPLASPLVSGFSVDDMMHGLLFPTFSPLLTSAHVLLLLLLMAILSVSLIACILLFVPKNNYRLFLIIFYLTSILFFSVAYLRQLNISYEGRHFRIIGLLMVPGVIYLVSKMRNIYKTVFGLICLLLIGVNYSFLYKGYTFNKTISARGTTGFAQEYINQESLDELLKLDRQNSNAIFVFVTPDIPLEIAHNRIITLDPIISGQPLNYDDYSYDGHAGPLYLFLPPTYDGDRAKTAMKFFPGYSQFIEQKLSGGYLLYEAK